MQSKSTFPARITPFSVPELLPFSREKQKKVRLTFAEYVHMSFFKSSFHSMLITEMIANDNYISRLISRIFV